MILAAGLGTRLRPLTSYLPKPLLPVAGVPLLDRAVAALTGAGVARIAVNAHHRADRIEAHLAHRSDSARFHFSLEPRILGTAGALHGARDFLAAAETFLVYNGDVLSDLDLAALLAAHDRGGGLATLVLVDWPEVNSVLLAPDGRVADVAGRLTVAAGPDDRALTFTGIACYDRRFLERVPAGPGDLVTVLTDLLREHPDAVRGHIHGGLWEDLGTLARYLDVHRRLLGPDFVSVGRGAVVPADAELRDCVVLAGAVVPTHARFRRTVLGCGWAVSERPDASADLALAARAGFDQTTRLEWITGHAGERRFVRLVQGDRRAVLMRTPADDPDHERFLAVAAFLYDRGLGAPAILAHDHPDRTVLLEDLGQDTLQALVAAEPGNAAHLYDRVLDRLADLQTFGAEARALCPRAWDRSFDRAHLRWETDYFRERFLVGHLGLAAGDLADLTPEFDALAAACLDQPRTLVHRDFQSQNILFKDGVVRLVDFQGMRWGPVAYDVVSLLLDPYVDLAPALVARLLAGFPERLTARGGPAITEDQWQAMTVAAALQRLMQALGAYGFLGHVKGRREYLDFIPVAVARLRAQVARIGTVGGEQGSPPAMPRLSSRLESVAD